MRILFVSTMFPSDLRTNVNGTYQRMAMFIDAIKEIAELDMLFFVPPSVDTSPSSVPSIERRLARHWNADLRISLCPRSENGYAVGKWKRYGASALSLHNQPGYVETSGAMQVQALENCLQRRPDAVFAHRLAAMCPLLLTRNDRPSIFLDLDDIEHIALLRGIDRQWDLRTKLISYMRVPSLWWGERSAIRAARSTFVCSEADRNYLSRFTKRANIITIPNAVSVQQPLPTALEPTLLFLGSYQYQPNVQAADFLIEKIWPRIRRAIPTAKLIIAGKAPERIRSYGNGRQGIEFTGFVEDLRNLYERSRVFCCPIFAGSGTRIKILEAAAYGKPIIATRLGAEGLELRQDREIFLHDNPESFAQACLKLLSDSELCRQIGSAAHKTVSSRYNRQKIVSLIQQVMLQSQASLN